MEVHEVWRRMAIHVNMFIAVVFLVIIHGRGRGGMLASAEPCNTTLPCVNGALQGDPLDCRHYYQCLNRATWLQRSCLEKLHFDIRTSNCVWENQATCQGPCPTTRAVFTGSTTPRGPTRKPGPCNDTLPCVQDGLQGNPDDCETFYQCDGGTTWKLNNCPSNLYFDVKSLKCSFKKDALCQGPCFTTVFTGKTSSITPQTTTTAGKRQPCDFRLPCTPYERLGDPRSCETYIKCGLYGKVWVEEACPHKCEFDMYRLICDNKGRVTCQYPCDRTTLTPFTGSTTPYVRGDCDFGLPCTPYEKLGNEHDCVRYYQCNGPGIEWLNRTCQAGFGFDYVDKKCVLRDKARCQYSCTSTARPSTSNIFPPFPTDPPEGEGVNPFAVILYIMVGLICLLIVMIIVHCFARSVGSHAYRS